MLFKKKIVFTEGMNETLCSFDEIPWFSCCGVSYDKPSYYPYLQEKDPKRAEKLLLHTKNYSGTVCLTNLFKEGICRADTFILQTAGWKFYQNEFMPCVEASPYDNIWGIRLAASSPEAQDPMKWRGQNLLGFALMEVRDELRRVTQNEMLCDWNAV